MEKKKTLFGDIPFGDLPVGASFKLNHITWFKHAPETLKIFDGGVHKEVIANATMLEAPNGKARIADTKIIKVINDG